MLKRAYVEITNVCNLHCAFCPGTRRPKRLMTVEEFSVVTERLKGRAAYLYLHVMGEPLLHPQLAELLRIGGEGGFPLCITTNGTLLAAQRETLLNAPALYKLSASLHSFEGSARTAALRDYLETVWDFACCAGARGVIVALRLWNEGGRNEKNEEILAFLEEKTGTRNWPEVRGGSFRLRERVYLERAEQFDWPDLGAAERDNEFCLALRQQLAVLADGTVVPCCLDHEGDIALGNLFTDTLEEILASPRARALYDGFSARTPAEALCRRCGYAGRFNR